jgi:PIN domain nuclease of toxin-antitoxin system
MKLILDTHIFLWFISGAARLPIFMRDAIRDPQNGVYLSVASLWEIIIKNKIGKLSLPQAPEVYIPKQRQRHRIKSLAITESAIKQLTALPPLHRDPFDRILISQALNGNMTVVTVDKAIQAYSVPYLNGSVCIIKLV